MSDIVSRSSPDHKITREDCKFMIDFLARALRESGFGKVVDFIAYGSYYETWRDGLSDLDGIFYFSGFSPINQSLRPQIRAFQKQVALLYKKMPFLKPGSCLYDIFILDSWHSRDGRFIMFDKEWVDVFWKYTAWELIHGTMFMDGLNPVSLRNQNEFELALGLHLLRNYLFFEIPRPPQEMSLAYAKGILKSFRVLPRVATFITGKPMARSPYVLSRYFKEIDYSSFNILWSSTVDLESQEVYLKKWHEPGNDTFIECLECFELTLAELVKNYPMKSNR